MVGFSKEVTHLAVSYGSNTYVSLKFSTAEQRRERRERKGADVTPCSSKFLRRAERIPISSRQLSDSDGKPEDAKSSPEKTRYGA